MLTNNMEKLNNSYKDHGCDPMRPSCIKMTTCKAKTSTLHDGTENVSHDIVGLGLKQDGNMGNLYNSYRDVTIVDTDALIQNIRAGNAPIQDQITKDAEYKARLYGSSYGILDGVPTGYTCIKCPPRRKACLKYPPTCKIPDPNNPETGIGSDLMESKESLLNVFEARRIIPEGQAIVSENADFQVPQGERVRLDIQTADQEEQMMSLDDMNLMKARGMGEFSPLSQMTMDEAITSEAGRSDATTVVAIPEGESVGAGILASRRKRSTKEQMGAERAMEVERFGRELTNNERQRFRNNPNENPIRGKGKEPEL